MSMTKEQAMAQMGVAMNQAQQAGIGPYLGDVISAASQTPGTAIAGTTRVWNSNVGMAAPRPSDILQVSIAVVGNGYVIGNGREHFIAADMDEVAKRVVALLAAHQMDMQK